MIAIYRVVSCGTVQEHKEVMRIEKESTQTTGLPVFPIQKGLHFLSRCFNGFGKTPKLWEV